MEIKELKKSIENKTIDDSFIVFQWSDTDFLVNQYIKEIIKIKQVQPVYIDSLKDYHRFTNSFFNEDDNNYLYILRVDEFSVDSENVDFNSYKNVIVVCNKIKDTGCLTKFVVKFPKLETWQILDYMKVRCPEMSDEELQWLEKVSKEDIYKIDSELDKISIFDGVHRRDVFRLLNNEGGYEDLTTSTFFDFINCLKVKDKNKLIELFEEIDNIDVEPTGVVTLMSNEIKKILTVKQDTKNNFEAVGMSEKQYKFYKLKIVNLYTNKELTKIYKFLVDIDYKLKSGLLGNISSDRNKFIDYLVCGMLSCQ